MRVMSLPSFSSASYFSPSLQMLFFLECSNFSSFADRVAFHPRLHSLVFRLLPRFLIALCFQTQPSHFLPLRKEFLLIMICFLVFLVFYRACFPLRSSFKRFCHYTKSSFTENKSHRQRIWDEVSSRIRMRTENRDGRRVIHRQSSPASCFLMSNSFFVETGSHSWRTDRRMWMREIKTEIPSLGIGK